MATLIKTYFSTSKGLARVEAPELKPSVPICTASACWIVQTCRWTNSVDGFKAGLLIPIQGSDQRTRSTHGAVCCMGIWING